MPYPFTSIDIIFFLGFITQDLVRTYVYEISAFLFISRKKSRSHVTRVWCVCVCVCVGYIKIFLTPHIHGYIIICVMPFTMTKIPFAVHIHHFCCCCCSDSLYFVGFWKFKLHLRSPRSYIFICIKKYFQYFCINWFYLPPGVYNTTFKLLRASQNFFTHK